MSLCRKTTEKNKNKVPGIILQEAEKATIPDQILQNEDWGRELPSTLSQGRVHLALLTVPRGRNTKRIPRRTAKTIVGVSEHCTKEAEKNRRRWVKSSKASPQPGGLLHCLAIEWLCGSHDTINGTVMNDSTAHPRYLMKSHLFPYLCSFQLQVSSSYLLT